MSVEAVSLPGKGPGLSDGDSADFCHIEDEN